MIVISYNFSILISISRFVFHSIVDSAGVKANFTPRKLPLNFLIKISPPSTWLSWLTLKSLIFMPFPCSKWLKQVFLCRRRRSSHLQELFCEGEKFSILKIPELVSQANLWQQSETCEAGIKEAVCWRKSELRRKHSLCCIDIRYSRFSARHDALNCTQGSLARNVLKQEKQGFKLPSLGVFFLLLIEFLVVMEIARRKRKRKPWQKGIKRNNLSREIFFYRFSQHRSLLIFPVFHRRFLPCRDWVDKQETVKSNNLRHDWIEKDFSFVDFRGKKGVGFSLVTIGTLVWNQTGTWFSKDQISLMKSLFDDISMVIINIKPN